MHLTTLPIVFAAGFVIMTPVGPVSSICIRRALIYGTPAGIAAGAGNAIAAATYATVGVTGSALLSRILAPFATVWHIAISVVLLAVSILIWKSRPALPKTLAQTSGTLASGFGAALAMALANPADIVLFATLFAGLGIAVHTPLEQVGFCAAFFAGGCAYWVALSLFLGRWRTGLTLGRIVWLNRACSAFMLAGAAASLVSLA